jgi:hypothetical protein
VPSWLREGWREEFSTAVRHPVRKPSSRRRASPLVVKGGGGEGIRTPGFLRASKWRLTAVRSRVSPGHVGPSGMKLGVLMPPWPATGNRGRKGAPLRDPAPA